MVRENSILLIFSWFKRTVGLRILALRQQLTVYKRKPGEPYPGFCENRIGSGFYPAQGRFTSADAPFIAQKSNLPQSWNLYSYTRNNPLKYVDQDGRSTHTDWSGNVVAVYDDGNLGVYRHFSLAWWDGKTTLPTEGEGIEWMGETLFWDEFVNPETKKILPGTKIDFDATFDDLLKMLNSEAQELLPGQLAILSFPNEKFDIKKHIQDPKINKLLNGKYATVRSAGNYLAGLNGASIGISANDITATAGALHKGFLGSGLLAVAMNRLLGMSFGEEIPYAQRQIDLGIQAGKKIDADKIYEMMLYKK